MTPYHKCYQKLKKNSDGVWQSVTTEQAYIQPTHLCLRDSYNQHVNIFVTHTKSLKKDENNVKKAKERAKKTL